MNKLGLKLFSVYTPQNNVTFCSKTNQVTPEQQTDSFTRQTQANNIVNDEQTRKSLAEFLTAGFMYFMRNNNSENAELPSFESMQEVNEKLSEAIDKKDEEISQLRQEIEELKNNRGSLKVDETETTSESQVFEENQVEEDENTDEQKSSIAFPSKRGRLSVDEMALKTLIEEKFSGIDETVGIVLSKLIKSYMQKGETELNGEVLQNKDILNQLKNDLETIQPIENEVVDIIIKYTPYTKENNDSTPVETPSNNKNSISTRIEKPQVKVVGKIDIDNKTNKVKGNLINEIVDDATKTYRLKLPGTISPNVSDNIHLLMKYYKLNVPTDENTKFMKFQTSKKYPVINVREKDVAAEIRKQIEIGTPYQNIKNTNIPEIVSIINSGVFKNMFTLHSAMRFIDRYGDFYGDLEQSCKNGVDVMLKVLQASFESAEGINYQIYKCDHDSLNIYCPRVILDPSKITDENLRKDFESIFGNIPSKVTFAYNYHNMQKVVISTIFW